MRILKRRISEAKRFLLERPKLPLTRSSSEKKHREPIDNEILSAASVSSISRHPIRKSNPSPTQDSAIVETNIADYSIKATKNIVKNYARAICNFISMDIAQEYIDDLAAKFQCDSIDEFKSFVFHNKESVDCIQRFKSMILTTKHDCAKLVVFKKMFQAIGELFIKYFSVNWIYSGRLKHKKAHLAFRFKMLRRLKNPHLFTYLKSFNKKI